MVERVVFKQSSAVRVILRRGSDAITVREVASSVTVSPNKPRALVVQYKGISGAGGQVMDYVHTQTDPLAEWTVNHNLNRRPAVTVLIGAAEVDAEVVHVSPNQLRVYFASPQAGTARCL